jgi:hypothetical protein
MSFLGEVQRTTAGEAGQCQRNTLENEQDMLYSNSKKMKLVSEQSRRVQRQRPEDAVTRARSRPESIYVYCLCSEQVRLSTEQNRRVQRQRPENAVTRARGRPESIYV